MNDPLKRPSYSTQNQKKRYIESEIRRILALPESTSTEKYLDGSFGNRRMNAILNYLERAQEEFKSFGLTSVVESFVGNELVPVMNYNRLDEDCDLRIAAALWILDRLRAAGKMKEAYDLLPDVSTDPEAWYLPLDFSHPCYSVELIHSVIHVMSTRYPAREHDGVIITEDNARGKRPSWTWERLLDLLPEEMVKAACDTFTEKIWEMAVRKMKGRGIYEKALAQTISRIRFVREGGFAPLANPELKKKKTNIPPADMPDSGNLRLGTLPGLGGSLFTGFYDEAEDEPDDLEEKGRELLDKEQEYVLEFDEYLQMDRKTLRKKTNRDVADALDGFTIKDPYEICFALLYLIDKGDDSPWLFRSGFSLVLYALRMLPWYVDEDGWTDEDWDYWYGGMEYNRNGWLDQEPVLDEIDYYHTKHGEKNLAQIIYEMCRGVVPTGLHPFEKDRIKLVKEGMDEETARRLTDTAELLFLYAFQAKQYVVSDDYLVDEEEEEADEEEPCAGSSPVRLGGYWGKVASKQSLEAAQPETTKDNLPDLNAENKRLLSELDAAKKQIKSLRSALALTRQELGSERAKNERDLKTYRLEHRELADLRELVFNRELDANKQARREKPEKQYAFPYETKKRTVVFGGHDSFLRAIKPLLPNVKYVDARNLTYSPEIIRNADVVWIQNNCISHSQYWSIVKNCKLAGIQVRYFAYASAEKCARQLADEDQK